MATTISDILTAERVVCGVQVASKKRALEKLSDLIASAVPDLAPGEVFDCLIARERLGSTGLGHGIALPHGRVRQVDRAVGAFMRLGAGVDYDAVDQQPVDMLFGLLLPDSGAEEGLQLLAALAERFDDPGLRERLRASERCEDLFALIARGGDGP
jgi:PTS system nitrogen regulatory IIA component